MLKNYTGKSGMLVDSTNKVIAIVSIVLFNESAITRTATLYLLDANGDVKSQILETKLSSKETLTIDTKIFLSAGDTLSGEGVTFTISGDEDPLP